MLPLEFDAVDGSPPSGVYKRGMEILADGFEWAEGPVWVENGGYLLFSDVPSNKVCRFKDGEGASIYLQPSGATGTASTGSVRSVVSSMSAGITSNRQPI